MSRFEVSEKRFNHLGVLDNNNPDDLLVRCQTKAQAGVLVDFLNDMQEQINSKPLDLHKDFELWNEYINNLASMEKTLVSLKQYRDKEKMRMINEVDFKKIYGKNNDDIRKYHTTEELSDTIDKINSLELEIADIKRKISCLKRLIDMKIQLIRIGIQE